MCVSSKFYAALYLNLSSLTAVIIQNNCYFIQRAIKTIAEGIVTTNTCSAVDFHLKSMGVGLAEFSMSAVCVHIYMHTYTYINQLPQPSNNPAPKNSKKCELPGALWDNLDVELRCL